jgi:hypothetical protein
MQNIKIKHGWWEMNILLYIQCSIDDKLINLLFITPIIRDIFYNDFDPDNKESREEAKNKVIKAIETKDDKLNYLIQEALKDKIVQEQLATGQVAEFDISMEHFYSYTNSYGNKIYKDYRD